MTQPFPSTSTPTPGGSASGASSSDLVGQAQDKMGQVVDQAQQTAGQVTEQAKQQATSQLESQKDRAVDTLVTISQALRQTGQNLHEQQQGTVAGYVDQAAQRVEGLTNHLRTSDVTQLLNETQDLARRQPGLFIGTAVALGFVGARFLMSSGQRAAAQRSFGTAAGSTPPYALPSPTGLPSPAPSSSPYRGPSGAVSGGYASPTAPAPTAPAPAMPAPSRPAPSMTPTSVPNPTLPPTSRPGGVPGL